MKDSQRPPKSKPSKNAGVKIVAAQSVKGHGFTFDENLCIQNTSDLTPVPSAEEDAPYRLIDGQAVYHVDKNKAWFEEGHFDVRKIHRWGELLHPRIVLCSYEISGDVRFYVDTRVPDYYLLWTATRVHFDEFPGVSYDLVAWTPRSKGDTVRTAGFRLVHAALLDILYAPGDGWHCDMLMASDMEGTAEVGMIIGSIAPTVHLSSNSLLKYMNSLPEYLRPLYEEGASIGEVECLYE
jgi:hypothetical protein